MAMPKFPARASCLAALTVALIAIGAVEAPAEVTRRQGHVGMMTSELVEPGPEGRPKDVIRFEPWQMLGDLFSRDDYVFLMRHGPTDWSKRDAADVAPDDCENQRVLSEQGRVDMTNLGRLMAENGLLPGKIMVSEWCRNQQTLDALLAGIAAVDAEAADRLRAEAETRPALNLLLSLQGAPNVAELREIVMGWDGGDVDGPLLVISHYTNIEELTEFRVYEGEMLMVDPDRDGRVLGYLRLRSAEPDAGHFSAQTAGDDE